MSKSAYFGKETQKNLVNGLNLVANAVKSTLGPCGSTVVIARKDKHPLITKDGVSVAKEIAPKDEKLKLGADLAISIAQKQMNAVGDGCQPLWEKIMTPTGYITFADVKEGDAILGSDGKSQEVIKVYDKGEKALYKLTFTHGETVVCSPDHMWTLKNKKTGEFENKKVEEIINDYIAPSNDHTYRYKWSLPRKPVTEFEEQTIKIDPFILGAYLGDGHVMFDTKKPNSPRVAFTLNYTTKEQTIFNRILELFPKDDIKVYEKTDTYFKVRLTKDTGRYLYKCLGELDLLGKKAKDKFIPALYKYNSIDIREQVLAGLFATDGSFSGNKVSFGTSSETLASDIKELAQSLGYNVWYHKRDRIEKRPQFAHSVYTCYDLCFYMDQSNLISIEPLGYSEPVRCIKVSNSDELYLTSNYLVTHNTTTATVLGQALVNSGMQQLELGDNTINTTSFRRGIEKARDYVIERLNGIARPVETLQEMINIATVSANNDEKLGTIVAQAYDKVGKSGVVLVEETKDRDIRLEFKEGMTFNKGWTSQYFINKHDAQTAEYDNAKVLLCNSKISNFSTLANVIQDTVERGTPLVIIAESFDTSVTQGLALNIYQSRGQVKVVCIEAPGYGERRLEILRDMGVYLGCPVADDPLGVSFEAMSSADFGSCEKIIVKKDETVIRGGGGEKSEIDERVETIKGLMSALKENDTFEYEQLNKRLASLTTGIAIIKVGGSSEEEIGELRDRLDDATWSMRAALESGYVPGAGNTLLYISQDVENSVLVTDEDEKLGIKTFAAALKAPFRTILENAGLDYKHIADEVLARQDVWIGYNSKTNTIENLGETGIIDALKVLTGVVYAASSIASVTLTTKVMITTDPEENKGLSLNMMPGMM